MAHSGSSSRGLVLLLITSGFFITGLLFDYMPMIIDDHIKRTIELATNEEIIGLWSRPPVEVQTYYWLYDIVNPEQFATMGAKVQVRKIGPFHFSTQIEKRILGLSANKFRVTYNSTRYSKLNESYSSDLLDQPLSLLNPVMVSIVEGMRVNTREMDTQNRNIAAGTINKLLERYNETLVHNVTARTALMGKDIPIVDKLKRMAKAFGVDDKFPDLASVNKFGYASITNATWSGPFEIYTGYQETARSLGDLISYKGKRRLDYYDGKCNRLQTSAGELRPMPVEPDKPLEMFQPNFCRIVHLKPTGMHKLREGQAISYIVSPDDFLSAASNPDNRCFCTNVTEADDHCSLDGVIELAPCSYNAPVMVAPSNVPLDPKITGTIHDFDPDMLRGDVEQLVSGDDDAQIVILRRIGVPVRADITLTMFIKVIRDPTFKQTINVPEVSYVPLATVREKVVIPPKWAQIIVNLESFLSLTYHIKVVMYLTAIVLLCWLTGHYYCHNAPAQLDGSGQDPSGQGGDEGSAGPDGRRRRRSSNNMMGGGGGGPGRSGSRGRQSSVVGGGSSGEQGGGGASEQATARPGGQLHPEPLSAETLMGVAGTGDGPISPPGASFRLSSGNRARRSTVIALASQLSTVDERPSPVPVGASQAGVGGGQSVDTASWNERANSGDSNRSLPPSRRTSRLNSLEAAASETTTVAGGLEESDASNGGQGAATRGVVSTKPSSVARIFSQVDSELRARNNQVGNAPGQGGGEHGTNFVDDATGQRRASMGKPEAGAGGVKKRRNGWFMSVYSNLVRMLNGLRNTINEDGAGQLNGMQHDYQDRQLEMLAGKIDNWYTSSSIGEGVAAAGAGGGGQESAGAANESAAAAPNEQSQGTDEAPGSGGGGDTGPAPDAALVRNARAAPAYDGDDQIGGDSGGGGSSSVETVGNVDMADGSTVAAAADSNGDDNNKDATPQTATPAPAAAASSMPEQAPVPTVVQQPNTDSSTQTDDAGPSDGGGAGGGGSGGGGGGEGNATGIIESTLATATSSQQESNGIVAQESDGGGAAASSSPPRPATGVPADEQLASKQDSDDLGQSSSSGLALAEAANNQQQQQQQQQLQYQNEYLGHALAPASDDTSEIESQEAECNRQLDGEAVPTMSHQGSARVPIVVVVERENDGEGTGPEQSQKAKALSGAGENHEATSATISGSRWDSSNGASLTLSNEFVDEDDEVDVEVEVDGEEEDEIDEREEEIQEEDEAAKAATLKQIEAALNGSPEPKFAQHRALSESLARLNEETPEASVNGGGDDDDVDDQGAKFARKDGSPGTRRGRITSSLAVTSFDYSTASLMDAASRRQASSASSVSSEGSRVTQIARSSNSAGRWLDVDEAASLQIRSPNQSDSSEEGTRGAAMKTYDGNEREGKRDSEDGDDGRQQDNEIDESSRLKQQQQQQQRRHAGQLSKLSPNEVVKDGLAPPPPINGALADDDSNDNGGVDAGAGGGKTEATNMRNQEADLSTQTTALSTTTTTTKMDTNETSASLQFNEDENGRAQRDGGEPVGGVPRITTNGLANDDDDDEEKSNENTNSNHDNGGGSSIQSGSLSESTKTSSASGSTLPGFIVNGNGGVSRNGDGNREQRPDEASELRNRARASAELAVGNRANIGPRQSRAGRKLNGRSARLGGGASGAATATAPLSASLLSADSGQFYTLRTGPISKAIGNNNNNGNGDGNSGINKRQINEILARSQNVHLTSGQANGGTSGAQGDWHPARSSALLGQSRPMNRAQGRQGPSSGLATATTTATTTSTSVNSSNGLKTVTASATVTARSPIPNGFGSSATSSNGAAARYNNTTATSTTFPPQQQQQLQHRQAGIGLKTGSASGGPAAGGGGIISSSSSSTGSSRSSSGSRGLNSSSSSISRVGNNILNEKIISQQRGGSGAGADGVTGGGVLVASFASNQRSANETTGNHHHQRRVQPAGA